MKIWDAYQSAEELKLPFSVFKENLPDRLSVNQFADFTWKEFERHSVGAAQNDSATIKGSHKLTEAALLETIV
ncbi:unnamed protein product [Microthlaspi erraticum]|uniref:Uncharacterized protein n=1 Tax=Microthlaspi erraticum TaxID=1685480 RepID=A0A6D2IS33_9BRAS|nr:unnamed protein product [Microthlaspi erraticum]CAA7028445.1 unnamed protein product [Microthlaspi erraticum]